MSNRMYCLTMALLLGTIVSVLTGLSVSNSTSTQAKAVTATLQDFNWTQVSNPVTTTLNSVAMVAANDGWAVGENGTLLRYDGNAWISYSLPVTTTLLSVSMSSANNGWALGLDNTSTFIQILLRWNGANWESVEKPSVPRPFYMADISVPNDTSAWVAGGIIVCAVSYCPDAADGTIAHWNGSSWSDTHISGVFLSSISMVSDTDGWAVGTEVVQPTKQLRSSVLHWDGYTWTGIAHPIIEYPGESWQYILEEVSALNATNAWAAVSGQNTFLRWSGSAWTQVDSPVGGRPSITAVSSNDAWAVGGEGVIGHWDGNIWTQVSSPVTATLTSVAMVSANEGWAVGNGGTIVHGIRHPADADLRLSIKYAGNGTGTVTDTLASGTLVLPSIYAYGSVVTLTASADADSLFAGWSGDVTGLTNPITLTMDSNKTVTATFSLNIYMPTVITVTTTTDELNNDGDCSLREAVQASNTDTAVDACPAGNGDDAIILSANTYTLTIEGRSEDANAEGDLDVTGVLTITGMGAPTTTIQSGADAFNGIDRVIHVLSSSNLTIQNVQIRNGLASYGGTPHIDGGGIYVAENSLLNIDNCTIAYNWGANGGGITSAANTTVNINNSIISNNHSHSAGGGLMSYGTVNIGNTTFDRNTGMFGGAVSAPNGNITNSTFSENSAVELIGPPGYGAVGGATVSSGVLNISNSTISGNTAVNEGGGIRNSGQMHISSCTITDNESPRGGGILDFGGIVTVTNSVIAANAGGNCSGAIVSSDYNIDSDNTCNLTRPNDQANMDPMLDPLADNGGPTWTHALSPGSLAINTGDCSGGTITVDQRSVTRPQGYACDIGAYEYDGDPFVITTDDSFTVSEDVTLVVGPPGVLSNDLSFSTLTTALGISPTNGALSFDVDGSFLYTPTSNFSGMDWFTYVASDGTLTDTAVVTITIVAVNDAPIAIEDVYTTTAGTTLTVLAPGVLGNDTDAEREPLLAVLDTLAMSGTLVFNPDGSFVYTPDTGFIGVDSFTYHASDRSEDSNQIAVKVMVNPTLVYLPIVRRK